MKWPVVEALATLAPLPAGYRFAELGTADIAAVIAALRAWYPDISVGAASCYLREDFYRQRVCLDGAIDKDIAAYRIMSGDDMAGFWSFEREEDSLAIWGRLLVVAPEHRGVKLSRYTFAGSENIARAMGAAFMYGFATLKSPFVQQAMERAGYRLLGVFPGRDREEVAPGVVKRVYQSVYAKLLVPPDQVHWPDTRNMTPGTRRLYELLFSDRPGAGETG